MVNSLPSSPDPHNKTLVAVLENGVPIETSACWLSTVKKKQLSKSNDGTLTEHFIAHPLNFYK
jgi:hypothetical protein